MRGSFNERTNAVKACWTRVAQIHAIEFGAANIVCTELDAASAGRETLLRANLVMSLMISKAFRSREQIEAAREGEGKRNPLTRSKTLGKFLEVAWATRSVNDNETGVHYLISMLLWGRRESEHAPCKWADLLSREERAP